MRILRVVGKSLATTLVFVILAECFLRVAYFGRNALVSYVPLPYVVGDDYGPIPPWLDDLLILRPDEGLIWANIPNAARTYVDIFTPVWSDRDRMALLRRFAPWLPAAFRSNPVWHIALNDDGYRSPPTRKTKRPGTVRIACIGDSWTFGMSVNEDQTYPSRLAALLRRKNPHGDFEILNFGVLGYSSFQGLQVLKRRALDLDPDILLIGFGMNDSEVAGYRDKDMVHPAERHWRERVKELAGWSELYKLLEYFALVVRFHPRTMGDYLNADAGSKSDEALNYDDIEPWTRVSPRDYEANIREMIDLARSRGVRVVLLDNELWAGSPYRATLARVARDENLPLVDSVQIIIDAKKRIERELEAQLDLQPAPGSPSTGSQSAPAVQTVVFRVYQGSYAVPRQISIAGTDARLANAIPNTVLMHDDGTGGDQRAGDRVWSYQATFPVGTHLRYVYTNSGPAGMWEGLDVPHIRELQVEASADGRARYLPIETFGRIYMQADNWHTDAVGYELIAEAVLKALARQAGQARQARQAGQAGQAGQD